MWPGSGLSLRSDSHGHVAPSKARYRVGNSVEDPLIWQEGHLNFSVPESAFDHGIRFSTFFKFSRSGKLLTTGKPRRSAAVEFQRAWIRQPPGAIALPPASLSAFHHLRAGRNAVVCGLSSEQKWMHRSSLGNDDFSRPRAVINRLF